MVDHPIAAAERIDDGFPVFEQPATIADVLGHLARTPSDPRRLEMVDGASDAIGNALDEKILVGIKRSPEHPRVGPARAHPAVRMGGRHHQVIRRNAGRFGNQALGRVEHRAGNPHAIHHGESQTRGPIVEYQTTNVQFVVNMHGRRRLPAADPGCAEWRGDIARGGAGLEDLRAGSALRGVEGDRGHGEPQANKQDSEAAVFHQSAFSLYRCVQSPFFPSASRRRT